MNNKYGLKITPLKVSRTVLPYGVSSFGEYPLFRTAILISEELLSGVRLEDVLHRVLQKSAPLSTAALSEALSFWIDNSLIESGVTVDLLQKVLGKNNTDAGTVLTALKKLSEKPIKESFSSQAYVELLLGKALATTAVAGLYLQRALQRPVTEAPAWDELLAMEQNRPISEEATFSDVLAKELRIFLYEGVQVLDELLVYRARNLSYPSFSAEELRVTVTKGLKDKVMGHSSLMFNLAVATGSATRVGNALRKQLNANYREQANAAVIVEKNIEKPVVDVSTTVPIWDTALGKIKRVALSLLEVARRNVEKAPVSTPEISSSISKEMSRDFAEHSIGKEVFKLATITYVDASYVGADYVGMKLEL
jgi:hypothetical protein